MNQRIRIYLTRILLAASIIFTACSPGPQKEKNENTAAKKEALSKQIPLQFEAIEKRKIFGNIKCKADTSNNYALYVPSSYTPSAPSAVIFFFDAQASGALPLKKYKNLADKYGYILAGSNNSRNGNSAEVNVAFARNMIHDVQTRLSIDQSRVYTSGFSGGSRVASSVAIFDGGINTVIGCGAGFPAIEKPIENKFNYIGIAGNEDFNYNEMQDLENMLKKSDVEHVFLPFNGKHEWCPAEIMEKAFTWIQFKAMKQNLIPKNDSIVRVFLSAEKNQIEGLIKKNKKEEALFTARQTFNFISGLSPDTMLLLTISQLENSKEVKKARERQLELAQTEKALKDQYLNAMALKEIPWWKTETQRLNDTKRFPTDQVVMNKRILSFLSLACYMNINQLMHANQMTEAEHYLTIYKIIDPTNAEAPYLQALIYFGKKENDKALEELKSAAKLGFKEYERFEKDFGEITHTAKGREISASIKENAAKEG